MSNPTDVEGAQEAFDAAALLERYRVERDKRLHSPGEEVYLAPSGNLARYLDDPYAEEGRAARQRRSGRVRATVQDRTCEPSRCE